MAVLEWRQGEGKETGMSDSANLDVLRRGWEAFVRGDEQGLEVIMEMLDNDIVWHELHEHSFPGDYVGKARVRQHIQDLWEVYAGVGSQVPLKDEHDHIVVTDVIREKANPNKDHPCLDAYHFENGKVKEIWTCLIHTEDPLDEIRATPGVQTIGPPSG